MVENHHYTNLATMLGHRHEVSPCGGAGVDVPQLVAAVARALDWVAAKHAAAGVGAAQQTRNA